MSCVAFRGQQQNVFLLRPKTSFSTACFSEEVEELGNQARMKGNASSPSLASPTGTQIPQSSLCLDLQKNNLNLKSSLQHKTRIGQQKLKTTPESLAPE